MCAPENERFEVDELVKLVRPTGRGFVDAVVLARMAAHRLPTLEPGRAGVRL